MLADSFQVSQNVWIEYELDATEIKEVTEYSLTYELQNPYEHNINRQTGSLPVNLYIVMIDELEKKYWFPLKSDLQVWKPGLNQGSGRFAVQNLPAGNYYFHLGVRTGDLFPCINSKVQSISVMR